MTWDTEESSEAQSAVSDYDSALLWSDDPEKAYFRSMLNEQQAAKGADSLIGDSTLGELLDDNTLCTNEGTQRKALGTGLTIAEDDTLAKIEPDQKSIHANWFQRRKEMQKKPEPIQTLPIAHASPLATSPLATSPRVEQLRTPAGNQPPDELPVIRVQGEEFPSFIFVTPGHSSAVKTKERPVNPAGKSVGKETSASGSSSGNRRSEWFYGKIAIILLLVAVIISMVMLALILTQKKNNNEAAASQGFPDAPTFSPDFGFPPIAPIPTPRQSPSPNAGAPPSPQPTIGDGTKLPTFSPTLTRASHSGSPTAKQTKAPASPPTPIPSPNPTPAPINSPIAGPTPNPTPLPTKAPTEQPTPSPTLRPTKAPTRLPTSSPSPQPSRPPVVVVVPTPDPTSLPTPNPTKSPTASPTTQTLTESPTDTIPGELFSEIISLSPLSASALSDVNSPQYRALEWVVKDARSRGSGGNRMLSMIDTNTVQRWVLAVLYYSTDGDDWVTKSGWLTPSNECQWHGIECNNNGEINVMTPRHNNLAGSLPLELYLLSDSLEYMYMNSNVLTGTIPTTFGLLTNLERLSLTINELSGSIPSEFGGLRKLGLIGLGRNKLDGELPSELSSMSGLKTFDMSANNIRGTIPPGYASWPKIEDLSLQTNWISGQLPTEFGATTTMKTFDVAGNIIQGEIPPEYGNMINLESLSLQNNLLVGQIPHRLGRLSLLGSFDVSRTNLTGDMPSQICQLPIARIGADCEEITCRCCDFCCVDGVGCHDTTRQPTRQPTFTPTATPVRDATPRPTKAPTKVPTAVPAPPPTSPPPTAEPTHSPTKAPTPAPTPAPTLRRTPSPTPEPTTGAPTQCPAEITTDKNCYVNNEDIVVSFENCDARPDDWIGVYPATANPDDLGDPITWVWSCGDRLCSGIVESGEVTFYRARGRGVFQVFLVRRNSGGPYSAYGIGNEFELSNVCQ